VSVQSGLETYAIQQDQTNEKKAHGNKLFEEEEPRRQQCK